MEEGRDGGRERWRKGEMEEGRDRKREENAREGCSRNSLLQLHIVLWKYMYMYMHPPFIIIVW